MKFNVARILTENDYLTPTCRMIVFSLESHEEGVSRLCRSWSDLKNDQRRILEIAGKIHDHLKPNRFFPRNLLWKEEWKVRKRLENSGIPLPFIENKDVWTFAFPRHGFLFSMEHFREKEPELYRALNDEERELAVELVRHHHGFSTSKVAPLLSRKGFKDFPHLLYILIQCDWIDTDISSFIFQQRLNGEAKPFTQQFFDYSLKYEREGERTTVNVKPNPFANNVGLLKIRFLDIKAPKEFPKTSDQMRDTLQEHIKEWIDNRGWSEMVFEVGTE